MLRINVNLFPKDGHRFKDADGVLFVGQSWRGVINKVIAYRRRLGKPTGTVRDEVVAQACKNNPSHCREENEAQVQQTKVVSLKGRVLAWLAACRRAKDNNTLPFIPNPQDAVHRADLCAVCPKNTSLPEGCGSCKQAVRDSRSHILGNRKVDQRLNGCVVLGCDLPTAVHLDEQRVDNPDLPHLCWRRIGSPV